MVLFSTTFWTSASLKKLWKVVKTFHWDILFSHAEQFFIKRCFYKLPNTKVKCFCPMFCYSFQFWFLSSLFIKTGFSPLPPPHFTMSKSKTIPIPTIPMFSWSEIGIGNAPMVGTDQEKMSTEKSWAFKSSGPVFHQHNLSLLKAHLIKNLLVSFTGNCSANSGFRCIIKSPVRGSAPCSTKVNKALI